MLSLLFFVFVADLCRKKGNGTGQPAPRLLPQIRLGRRRRQENQAGSSNERGAGAFKRRRQALRKRSPRKGKKKRNRSSSSRRRPPLLFLALRTCGGGGSLFVFLSLSRRRAHLPFSFSLYSQPQDPPPSEAVSGSSALEALPAVSWKTKLE